MSELYLHDVSEILISDVSEDESSRSIFRTIKITTKDGEEMEITCFSDETGNLIIQHEE